MDEKVSDPDLPGDEAFKPTGPAVEVVINTVGGPASAIAMTISPEAQAAIHHNRLRYAELAALRLGQPNKYAQTRYRY